MRAVLQRCRKRGKVLQGEEIKKPQKLGPIPVGKCIHANSRSLITDTGNQLSLVTDAR